MAAAFDVAGRLAEGDRALTVLDDYVAACQVLGLPSSMTLPELYRAESGLDLAALAADARSLDAATFAAQDALRLQGNGYRELTAQWSGTGGDAASGFLRTLTVAAEDVVAHLQRSAQALATLRDELWRAVDTKVDAVLRAEAQAGGHREEWRVAARAVLGGTGDAAAASEIVDQQVKPFVVDVVSGDLLPALQGASDAVAAAYDSAIAAVTPPPVSFAVPIVITPEWAPPSSSLPPAAPAFQAAAAAPLGALGTAAGWAPSAPAMSTEPIAAPAGSVSGAPEPALGASAAAPPAGLPGDVGLGSGVSGLGQQLADAIGGVLGSMAGFGSGPAGLGSGSGGLGELGSIKDDLADDLGLTDVAAGAEHDKPDSDDHDDGSRPDDESQPDSEDSQDGAVGSTLEQDEQPVDPAGGEPGPPAATTPSQPAPDPAPLAGPAEPVAEQANTTAKTPCEIAAEELPNVGE